MSSTFTAYQSQYFANCLTLQGTAEETISRSVASARVDMNPHQVEAAIFALRSPLSRGAILADEVGLGKTIESGLVIAQRWAERKRKILLIVPASLRKQWSQELIDKFSIRSEILESKRFDQFRKAGKLNPFDQQDRIVICSYQFAARKAAELGAIKWDLTVFDEAHKLRNVYKKDGSKTAKILKETLAGKHKLLLSATPLQNSLMELYGMVSVIDDGFFGSDLAFKEVYVSRRSSTSLQVLRGRLKQICSRTLRKQVQAEGIIRFTNRYPMTENFTPSQKEQEVYEVISEFLRRDNSAAIRKGNKALVTLVVRKILASSTFAIGQTLQKMIDRLEKKLGIDEETLQDYDAVDETVEEFSEENESQDGAEISEEQIKAEIAELKGYHKLATAIRDNAKGNALVKVLGKAFAKVEELGGNRKAVVFTESCRTQAYLYDLLASNGYDGKIVLMNGSNADAVSKETYQKWLERHKGSDAISGSKTADMKAAIVEEFRDRGNILIATESGAEGINLQFCCLVINFDLPWNPQRVEQRIGRCHRYGQPLDVVVVNFINKGNRADERVYELLAEKFKLFEGVFGASDEVLGAIESGVDIERRINDVLNSCRTDQEIEASFDALQAELDDKIKAKEASARQVVLENLDAEVHAKLKFRRDNTEQRLTKLETLLRNLVKAEFNGSVEFVNGSESQFRVNGELYSLRWKDADRDGGHFFRIGDEGLCDRLLEKAVSRQLPTRSVQFQYDKFGMQLSYLKQFRGKGGCLEVSKLSVRSLDVTEKLIVSGYCDDGTKLDPEECHKLLSIPAVEKSGSLVYRVDTETMSGLRVAESDKFVKEVEQRNRELFDDETRKIDAWAEESVKALNLEIADLTSQIKLLQRERALLGTLAEKLEKEKEVKALEKERRGKKLKYFEYEEKIEEQRGKLLDEMTERMKLARKVTPLFTIRWELV